MLADLISKVVRGAVGEVAGQQEDPFVRSVLRWFGTLQTHLVRRWGAVMKRGMGCSLRPMDPMTRQFVTCQEVALGACGFCGLPVCLHHALLSETADVVCFKCMAEVQVLWGRRVGAPAAASMPDEEALRKKHLKSLGLKDPTTWDEIRTEYRELAKKYHPDRLPPKASAAKREQQTQKLKELNVAFAWLRARSERAA